MHLRDEHCGPQREAQHSSLAVWEPRCRRTSRRPRPGRLPPPDPGRAPPHPPHRALAHLHAEGCHPAPRLGRALPPGSLGAPERCSAGAAAPDSRPHPGGGAAGGEGRAELLPPGGWSGPSPPARPPARRGSVCAVSAGPPEEPSCRGRVQDPARRGGPGPGGGLTRPTCRPGAAPQSQGTAVPAAPIPRGPGAQEPGPPRRVRPSVRGRRRRPEGRRAPGLCSSTTVGRCDPGLLFPSLSHGR